MNKLTLNRRTFLTLGLLLTLLSPWHILANEQEKSTPPKTIAELKSAIEKVMEENKVPAVGMALVNADGPVWITALGKADKEKNVDAHENTLFRIGSVSKMFVALSILKLQEEGRLSLRDRVRDLAPDVAFTNPWEDTHPILVEHLLEHTTGWDDLHLIEYAHNDPAPASLKEGLDFHPHSRSSRWIPGTRMAYCNAGPPVAAYIVEKITGQPFEDYVQNTFFRPMGMENMTYFASDAYKQLGATLYQNEKPQEYWHIIMRPSGAINASPRDMAKMVQFFIHRGMIDSVQLISDASLKRMETPSTTPGYQAGIENGYGLNDFTSPHKSFVYRSHDGAVPGALTSFSYLPEYKMGYALMINASNGKALKLISDLIRGYQTNELEVRKVTKDAALTEQQAAISGYYMPVNPRMQMLYFLEKIAAVQRIRCSEDSVFHKAILGGETSKYLPADGLRFKSAETGLVSMAQTTDPLAGEVIHTGWQILKRIPAVQAFGQLMLAVLWMLFMLSSVIFGLIWPIRYWRGKIPGGANIRVRLWSLLASLFVLCFFLLFALNIDSLELGNVNTVSIAIMLSSVGFALASVWSVVCLIKERKGPIKKRIYWYSAILSVLHLIVTFYFLWYGVIGFRTWA
jgi:CubicO group peptidase (beta-lactamase class C family)